MPRGLFVDAPPHAILADYTDAALQPGRVRFRTQFAAVKRGTMFHIFSGESPFQAQRFDPSLAHVSSPWATTKAITAICPWALNGITTGWN